MGLGPGAGLIGAQLVGEGMVDEEDVRSALREQVGMAVAEILHRREGEFVFSRLEEGSSGPRSRWRSIRRRCF